MLYDVWLSKSGGERRVTLEHDSVLAKDDAFAYENEVYSVVDVQPGHGDFDGVIAADWRGEVGPGQFVG